MSTKDRVREQGFCYDDEVPPSIPAGAPLRARRQPSGERPLMRRTYRVSFSSLRERLRRDA